jgi:ribosome biogenesis GTPase / thiamine phosphate phosphatase
MTLSDLGFDDWFDQKRNEAHRPELRPARITRVDRDRYLARSEYGEVQAEPTGKLLFAVDSPQDLPSVGDWVLVQYHNDNTLAIIHDVLPRKTFLRRKAAGHKVDYQIIAANIDVAFIMQSCDENFNIRRLERYLVIARDGHIEPGILLSKSDLVAEDELNRMRAAISDAHIDVPVYTFSNMTENGLDAVKCSLGAGKTYCLLGSSGVGKTTLLNHLLGREEFETNAVREKDGRGKHTTTRRQLTLLDNGALLIDTPGMRELGMLAVDDGLHESFSDIQELMTQCKFRDCSHTAEDGCAVLQAVQDGSLDRARYESYLKLLKESRFHQMSYVERRQKDKAFGKMVKTAVKELHKRKPLR